MSGPDAGSVRATAHAYLVARGEAEAAAALSRARIEVLGDPERWTVEGRAIDAVRVAVWMDPAGRARADADPALARALREAIGAAVESPSQALREVILLLERVARPASIGPGYREPAFASVALDGATVSASAAAYLAAEGEAELAGVLGRSETTLDDSTAGVARVLVALDAADLALASRRPDAQPKLRAAIEAAARTAERRVAGVAFALRASHGGAATGGAEALFVAAARASGWEVVAIERSENGCRLACVRSDRIVFVALDASARAWTRDRSASTR